MAAVTQILKSQIRINGIAAKSPVTTSTLDCTGPAAATSIPVAITNPAPPAIPVPPCPAQRLRRAVRPPLS
jgi:hypothetical protein